MSTLYDILGVDRKATDEEIKIAYRRKAATAHPDKGGSQAHMAELNRAWECLGDPVRRLEYDRTGHDAKQSIDEEASNALIQEFVKAVELDHSTNVLEIVERLLRKTRDNIDAQRSDAKCAMKALERKRDRVRLKKVKGRKSKRENKNNLFHVVVDAKINGLMQKIGHLARGIDVYTRAIEMLGDYEADGVDMASTLSTLPKIKSSFMDCR